VKASSLGPPACCWEVRGTLKCMPSVAPRPALRAPLPAVDEPLVAPESRFEIVAGKVFPVPPAQEPHASLNSKLAALLEAHVTEDFNVAVDMLTRTDELTNFAPDASVYPAARDPETGGRQLEHLAFEVVSTETLGHAATKAALLVERGRAAGVRAGCGGAAGAGVVEQEGSVAQAEGGQRPRGPLLCGAAAGGRAERGGEGGRRGGGGVAGEEEPGAGDGVAAGQDQGQTEGLREGLREGKRAARGQGEGLREGKAEGCGWARPRGYGRARPRWTASTWRSLMPGSSRR
jgi:hypothetical protein